MSVEANSPSAAPGELDAIRLFVNTADLEKGVELLTSPAALRDWLAARDLLGPAEPVTDADLRQAIEVREALRGLLLANNGEGLREPAVETLNAAAKSAELAVRFDGDGDGALAPVRSGFDGALARLLAIVFRAMAEGSWPRLKACSRHSCEWAFYDRSRNRSGRWCDMTTCGNREKARMHRERQKQTG